MTENDYMEIQDKLGRLFDGELGDGKAQEVLNQVAESPELQALYLEQKTLHSYLQNPYLPDAAGLKDGILSKIQLDSASVRNYVIRKYILRSALVGLLLIAFGGAYLLWNGNSSSDNNINKVSIAQSQNSINIKNSDVNSNKNTNRKVPIVTQTNLDYKSVNVAEKKNLLSSQRIKAKSGHIGNIANSNIETNIKTKYEFSSENSSKIAEAQANSSIALGKGLYQPNLLTQSNLFSDSRVALELNNSLPKYYLNPVYNYKTALILDRLNLQFNWYGLSQSTPNFKPATSKTGILNDFSLFLMYELTQNTSVGLSFGYDNFLMQYDGWEGNTEYRYSQEYSTPWIGCNINHRFEPILTFADYYEISPYVQLNTAYANVGIYTQASVGIEMGLSANTSFVAGFNSGWLFYKYENFEFTNKNGLNIGLKYGF